jgi:hypothetical protein
MGPSDIRRPSEFYSFTVVIAIIYRDKTEEAASCTYGALVRLLHEQAHDGVLLCVGLAGLRLFQVPHACNAIIACPLACRHRWNACL